MTNRASLVVHALIGWAICGATIGIGRMFLTTPTTLTVHAIVAPLAFGALTWHYFEKHPQSSPVNVAVVFVTVVITLDALLIAPVFERSYAMFRTVLGTWTPFALILAATYAVGRVHSASRVRGAHRSTRRSR
jgi:hypothetical protein